MKERRGPLRDPPRPKGRPRGSLSRRGVALREGLGELGRRGTEGRRGGPCRGPPRDSGQICWYENERKGRREGRERNSSSIGRSPDGWSLLSLSSLSLSRGAPLGPGKVAVRGRVALWRCGASPPSQGEQGGVRSVGRGMRGPAPPPWTPGNYQTCQGCGQSGGRRAFCGACEKPFCKRCRVDGTKGHPPRTARLWKRRRDEARDEEMQVMQMELAGQAAGEALARETAGRVMERWRDPLSLERWRATRAGPVPGEALAGRKNPEAREARARRAEEQAAVRPSRATRTGAYATRGTGPRRPGSPRMPGRGERGPSWSPTGAHGPSRTSASGTHRSRRSPKPRRPFSRSGSRPGERSRSRRRRPPSTWDPRQEGRSRSRPRGGASRSASSRRGNPLERVVAGNLWRGYPWSAGLPAAPPQEEEAGRGPSAWPVLVGYGQGVPPSRERSSLQRECREALESAGVPPRPHPGGGGPYSSWMEAPTATELERRYREVLASSSTRLPSAGVGLPRRRTEPARAPRSRSPRSRRRGRSGSRSRSHRR